jgi:hypothetical protein
MAYKTNYIRNGSSFNLTVGVVIFVIYNYLCNQYLSPLKLCVRIPLMPGVHYVIKFVSYL